MRQAWLRTISGCLLTGTMCVFVGCGGEVSKSAGDSKTGGAASAGRTTEGGSSGSVVDGGAPDGEASSGESTPPAAASAKPKVVDADQYAGELKRLAGKVVLVDFWATWCGPCKEQFPHSNALAKSLGEKGLAVVSVSFDDPDNIDSVSKFLAENPGPITHLLSTYGAGVESFDAFAIEGGAVPYYKLYDRTGKLRYQFCGDPEGVTGVIKIEELDGKIDELLGEKAE